MRRLIPLFLLLALLVASPTFVAAQQATPESAPAGDSLLADLGYPEIRVTSDAATHDFPTEIEAGRYHVILENTTDGPFEVDLELFQLPEGVTLDDLNLFYEAVAEDPDAPLPDYFYDVTFNGGPWALPGETRGVVLDLTPGEWVVNLLAYNPETDESTDTASAFTVTGEMPELDDPGGTEITMVDMDFQVLDTIAAGPQLWQVRSAGLQIHHLVLFGVPDGTTEEQVMAWAGSFIGGPAASPEAAPATELTDEEASYEFYVPLLSFGQYNLYEVDLDAGTYALVCFMPDPSGTPHVMLGMVEIIVVA